MSEWVSIHLYNTKNPNPKQYPLHYTLSLPPPPITLSHSSLHCRLLRSRLASIIPVIHPMSHVDAFIPSHASGSTSPTAYPTPIVTVHTESSTNLRMRFKLNESNYEILASMIELHATTQGKLGYLIGDTNAPDS
ncbi:hypothetical protein L3X38_004693 [Prunus dulcis]|uniref:Uncharacterized protein n=1 Tax=Prunus dulcis TaxID=3755 RepID=A0AAD4ZP98_PRUDU|nr:hypothetical protein L3X38_004693 [Prunus dulcis]